MVLEDENRRPTGRVFFLFIHVFPLLYLIVQNRLFMCVQRGIGARARFPMYV